MAEAGRGDGGGGGDEVKLTEKQLLNVQKQRLLRQHFMEFLLKQVAEVTYQYNCFENESLMAFTTVRPAAKQYNKCCYANVSFTD